MNRILTLLLAGINIIATAQERCGTEAYTKNITDNSLSYALARTKVNAQTEKWIEEHPNYKGQGIIIIPVVVHVGWNTNSPIHDSRIEIDVRVQVALHEVGITESNILKLSGHFQQWIFNTKVIQQAIAGFFDDLCSGIIVFVDAVTKSHQTGWGILVLHLLHELRYVSPIFMDHR